VDDAVEHEDAGFPRICRDEKLRPLDCGVDERRLDLDLLGRAAEEVSDTAEDVEQETLILRSWLGQDDGGELIEANQGLVREQDGGPAVRSCPQGITGTKTCVWH
jgi:hypothetical protein